MISSFVGKVISVSNPISLVIVFHLSGVLNVPSFESNEIVYFEVSVDTNTTLIEVIWMLPFVVPFFVLPTVIEALVLLTIIFVPVV